MVYFLYNLLLFLASPFYIIRVLWKNGGGKDRFGISVPGNPPDKFGRAGRSYRIIWIHAVSVGEVIASKPLISLINKQLPDYEVVLSTVTKTGREMADKLPDSLLYKFYFPFDFPFTIKKVLKRIKPSVIILAETELWPNLLRYAQHFNIPVILNNGKISPVSFSRYKKIRPFFKHILHKISIFCMQTEEDKEKLIQLEVNPDRIIVTGNTKFDLFDTDLDKQKPLENWTTTGFSPIIVAGSTHPGEEKLLLESFKKINKKFPNALLILAPRHPERIPEVGNLIKENGYSFVKRSETNSYMLKEKIILVDTIGELSKIYSVADVVFVGGSLVPIGGHNLLEPAFLAKPIILGQYTFKQKDMVDIFQKAEAVIQVDNKEQLNKKLIELLSSPEKRKKLGEKARNVVLSHPGATKRSFEVIAKLLQEV